MNSDRGQLAVVLLSGGINSTAAAMRVLGDTPPRFLYVDHGQAAARNEQAAAARIAEALAGTLHVVTIPARAAPVRTAHGADKAGSTPATPPATGCATGRPPGLMLAILAVAQRFAASTGAEVITCGASQLCNEADLGVETGKGHPDARHIFYHAAQAALELGAPTGRAITLDIPFIDVRRVDVIRIGQRLGAPFHLTWSCHRSGRFPCTSCVGCRSRTAAFDELGIEDPLAAGTASRVVREPTGG